jgi:hypothetical protein
MTVQMGTHDELIAQQGVYRTLMLRQWKVMHDA